MSSSPGFFMGRQLPGAFHSTNGRVWPCGALENGTLFRENATGIRQIRTRTPGKTSRRRCDRDQRFSSRREVILRWYVARYTSNPTGFGPYCCSMSGWASSLIPLSHILARRDTRRFLERFGSGGRQSWQMTLHHNSLPLSCSLLRRGEDEGLWTFWKWGVLGMREKPRKRCG